MRSSLLLAVIVFAIPVSASRSKHKARRADGAKKRTQTPPAKTEVLSSSGPAIVSRDEAVLASYGGALREDSDGLVSVGSWPGSPAALSGMAEGDRLLFIGHSPTRSRAEAASALRACASEVRESLVVRRGLAALSLVGEHTPPPPDRARGPGRLSQRESELARMRAERSASAARDTVAATPPLDWSLRADQSVWVRFPDGLPAGLKKDDVISAETAAALTTDGSLDFLAVPAKSRIWARVIASGDDGSVRTLRLAFFKIQPSAGGVYPVLGVATSLAGVPAENLARVSSGGTLVIAAPLPDADRARAHGKDLLLDEDARLRVRLLEPLSIVEPPSWWRAGPGLWVKTASVDGRRRFEVTHVVAGRSAAAEGIKPGDILDDVAGRSAEKMDFTDALDALYGAPGSTVDVSVVRDGKSTRSSLTRGVRIEKGSSTPLALPFEAR